jgi:hypothetical protein
MQEFVVERETDVRPFGPDARPNDAKIHSRAHSDAYATPNVACQLDDTDVFHNKGKYRKGKTGRSHAMCVLHTGRK